MAAWLEMIAIGVRGGDLYEAVMTRIGDPFFGVTLNPGHLIHLDEWMHSPVSKGSKARLSSGMAMQVDIIPATGSPWFTANMEDGIALLDERGRAESPNAGRRHSRASRHGAISCKSNWASRCIRNHAVFEPGIASSAILVVTGSGILAALSVSFRLTMIVNLNER
ncbi:MAG: hypothetical protein R3D29_10115 [Nitratireductor sp.]